MTLLVNVNGVSIVQRFKTEWRSQSNRSSFNDLMRIYPEGLEIVNLEPTPKFQQWFVLPGMIKRSPESVKPLNHDQSHKVELVDESEEEADTFFNMDDDI